MDQSEMVTKYEEGVYCVVHDTSSNPKLLGKSCELLKKADDTADGKERWWVALRNNPYNGKIRILQEHMTPIGKSPGNNIINA